MNKLINKIYPRGYRLVLPFYYLAILVLMRSVHNAPWLDSLAVAGLGSIPGLWTSVVVSRAWAAYRKNKVQ